MRSKRPRQASPDQVSITREGDIAVIENADPSISVVRLTVGPDLGSMTDAAILELFNDVIEAQEKLASKYDDTLIEIPPGKPQIRYSEGSDQWVPRGDVLRCHLDDDEAGELVVHVDDQELSLRDFGRLLRTFAAGECESRSSLKTVWPISLRSLSANPETEGSDTWPRLGAAERIAIWSIVALLAEKIVDRLQHARSPRKDREARIRSLYVLIV